MEIAPLLRMFCEVGAEAVSIFMRVTGEGYYKMPEFFMGAFILDHLGDKVTTTLETNFQTLSLYNANTRMRRGMEKQEKTENLMKLAKQLTSRRVDMVIYEGEEQGQPKNQQDIFALVEFKNGWISSERIPGKISDRDKLLMLLEGIDVCQWGIVCGCTTDRHIEWQKKIIQETDDLWFEQPIYSALQLPQDINFCARAFRAGSDAHRLAEIIEGFRDITD